MAVSRAALEAMDRDELLETIVELFDTVENLRTLTHTNIEKRKTLADEVTDLQERVDELEAENERLRDRLKEQSSKDEKVADIVEYAKNLRRGQGVVKVTPKEIAGAAGVSRRYGYDLCDPEESNSLPNEYDWILSKNEMQQYGDLEKDTAKQQTSIGIDFEGVHSEGVPVNMFTTGGESQG